MDKMSKDELWIAKIRRKGFSLLNSRLLTPEECFPEDISRDLELDKLKIAEFTEEEQEYWGQEYTKCHEDEVYFYNKYIKPEGFPDRTKEDFQRVREFNIGLKKRR